MLPFTHEQFVGVFATYNEAVWPTQIVAYGLAAGALTALAMRRPGSGRVAVGVIALMWAWTGVVYHGLYFSAINDAARVFAGFFVLQAIAFAWWGWRRSPAFSFEPRLRHGVGLALVLYAMVVYPLLGLAVGMQYPAMPTFGITPCPLTLFTLGVLLLATGPVPVWLLVVPVLWSLVGGSAAFLLHVPQDWVLMFSGVAAVALGVTGVRHAPRLAA